MLTFAAIAAEDFCYILMGQVKSWLPRPAVPDPFATLALYFQMAALTKKADFRNSKTGYVIF